MYDIDVMLFILHRREMSHKYHEYRVSTTPNSMQFSIKCANKNVSLTGLDEL